MRRFLWVPFAVALFAFVLPFATVSCDTVSVEPSGADFVLRTPPEPEGSTEDDFDLAGIVVAVGGGLATASFLAFALALLAALRGWHPGWVPFCGLSGIASLVLLKIRTHGGDAGGFADVDVRFGALLAAGAAAVGVMAGMAIWLRAGGASALRPFAPALGAALLVFGYLAPAYESDALNVAYADSLDMREPRLDTLWVVVPAVGMLLLARRPTMNRSIALLALAVMSVAAIAVTEDIWSAWRGDQFNPLAGSFVLLAGVLVSSAFAARVARRDRAGRPVAEPQGPARASAQASPPGGPSAPGSGGSPPAER